MTPLEIIGRFVSFIFGILLIVIVFSSALRTFVLPRSARDPLTRRVFLIMRQMFNVLTDRAHTYDGRDSIMALYAPLTLLVLPIIWLILVWLGYSFIFWAVEYQDFEHALVMSGSSLLTLGFERPATLLLTLIAFTEAALGLMLVTLLIAYLPTMYASFSRREAAVAQLEVRAGSPPSAVEMFNRYYRLNRAISIVDMWSYWETIFAEIEETHTSLAALVFFRSPHAHRSWVTASGAVLDAAALYLSVVDEPYDPKAALMIRSGYLALRHIADFFRVPFNPDPSPDDPISISRWEFDDACQHMAAQGVALKADRDQAWRDFSGWRVNYDTALLGLAAITMAPYAPWSSDRSIPNWRLPGQRKPKQRTK